MTAASGEFQTSAAMIAMTALAILPAIHLALIGPSELGSRILYLPSAGFCVMCAYLTSSIRSLYRQRLVEAALAVSVLVVLTHNLMAWHRTALLADQFCTNMALDRTATRSRSLVPSSSQGVPFFANGLPECISMKTRTLRSRRQG
jgi:hypothetical protein